MKGLDKIYPKGMMVVDFFCVSIACSPFFYLYGAINVLENEDGFTGPIVVSFAKMLIALFFSIIAVLLTAIYIYIKKPKYIIQVFLKIFLALFFLLIFTLICDGVYKKNHAREIDKISKKSSDSK
jgi:purine-cytosine permease-like protein